MPITMAWEGTARKIWWGMDAHRAHQRQPRWPRRARAHSTAAECCSGPPRSRPVAAELASLMGH